MKFALAQNMVRRPRVLRGGKAPLYWKREYSRLTEGLGLLPRTCNWVNVIAETQPRLFSEPLFGTCLTAVTSNGITRSDNDDGGSAENGLTPPHLFGSRNKETAFDPTASSKRRQAHSPAVTNQQSGNRVNAIAETQPRSFSKPLPGTRLTAADGNDGDLSENDLTPPQPGGRNKETAFDPTGSSKRPQVHSPAVTNQQFEKQSRFAVASQLRRRAPESLLRRAAPDTLPAGENSIRATSSLPRGGPGSPSPDSSPQITRAEWLRLVAARAARSWTSGWDFPLTRKNSSPTAGKQHNESHAPVVSTTSPASDGPARTSPPAVETIFLPRLQDDWLLPIAGQQASPQLLASLVKRPVTAHVSRQNIHRNKQTSSGIDSEPHSLPSAPEPVASRRQSITDGPEFSRPPERLFDRQFPVLAEDSDRSYRSESTIDFENGEQRASPNFAPPVLTPALSPLLPPASAGAPIPSFAADTARRTAWRDEVEARETDLSVLAAQVKRILDEEARRHGIDV